jgi:hypothetical protein
MLNKLVRRRGAGGNGAPAGPPTIYVGAFGKHPAWHDHIHPAIGLDGRLTGVMETLYLGGIQKSIAAWREAAASDQVPFAHLFVWQTPADVVIGRMWHSRDAANPPRTDYPMVVCVQCANVPMDWALANVPPALDRLEAACKATAKRDGVEVAVDAAREELRRAVASSSTSVDGDGDGDVLARTVVALADDPRVGPEGLRRVEYVLHEASQAHPRQARVPRAADSEAAAVRNWSQFLEARFGDTEARNLARVLVAPAGGEWVDLILGTPDASHFRSLRFATNRVASDTETAYSLDGAFVRDADAFLARARATAARPASPAVGRTGGGAAVSNGAPLTAAGGASGLGMTEASADAIARAPAAQVPALSPLAPAASVDEGVAAPKAKPSRGLKDLVIWVVLGIVLAVAVAILVVVGRMDPGASPPGR